MANKPVLKANKKPASKPTQIKGLPFVVTIYDGDTPVVVTGLSRVREVSTGEWCSEWRVSISFTFEGGTLNGEGPGQGQGYEIIPIVLNALKGIKDFQEKSNSSLETSRRQREVDALLFLYQQATGSRGHAEEPTSKPRPWGDDEFFNSERR